MTRPCIRLGGLLLLLVTAAADAGPGLFKKHEQPVNPYLPLLQEMSEEQQKLARPLLEKPTLAALRGRARSSIPSPWPSAYSSAASRCAAEC